MEINSIIETYKYDVAERIKDADLERFLFRTYPAHQNTFAM